MPQIGRVEGPAWRVTTLPSPVRRRRRSVTRSFLAPREESVTVLGRLDTGQHVPGGRLPDVLQWEWGITRGRIR